MEKASSNFAVLFADISGSAKLYETLGDAEALATVERCLAIIRKACTDSGGKIVKTIGDEVMAVFSSADGAARLTYLATGCKSAKRVSSLPR